MNQSNVIQQENQLKAIDEFALNPESIKAMVKEYQNLEVIPGDKKSYKIVHEAKMILTKARTGTDKKRKELGSEARSWINDVNSAAKELIAPLLPLEEKLKSMLDTEDSREEKIEQARIEKIENLISALARYVSDGQVYNLGSETIQNIIAALESCEVSAVDYEEKTEQAEQIKAEGLETLGRILADRVKHEETQANQAAEAEKLAAEAEKLAADRAEFEAARLEERKRQDALQAKLDEERMIRQKEDAVKAAKDAEELRLQREEIDPDIKVHGFRQANKAEGNRITFEKYCAMWDEAVRLNMAIVNDLALEENAAFDHKSAKDEKIRKEAPMKSAAQNKLIKSDQKKIQTEINKIDTLISEIKPLDYATDEAAQVVADMYVRIKTALDDAEKAGCNLE